MTTAHRSRRIVAALLGLLTVLVLSACTLTPFAQPQANATSTPTGEQVAANLQPYYSQVIRWKACSGGAQCAAVRAPLDWSNPGDGDVRLAIARRTAESGTSKGSLFFNPGGPGASGVSFVLNSPSILDDSLRRDYDFVSWDPRGVGESSAVTCYTNPKDFDQFLFGVPKAPEGTDAWRAEVETAGKDFVAACAKNTGPLLAHIDTDSTVRDLDLLRALVGDTKLNYFGMSYGTKIGERYAQLYGSHIGRMTLDGVVNPAETNFQVVLGQTKGFDRALRNYLAACAKDDCPFTGSADAAIQQIAGLYAKLDASPLPGSSGRRADSSTLDIAIASALYDESQWPTLSKMFEQVQQGDSELMFALADQYFGRASDGTYADHFYEAFLAISCLDYPTETDPTVLQQQDAQLKAVTPLITGSATIPDPVCSNWPYPAIGQVGPVDAPDAPPILIVGTTGDPATPYESAQAVHEQIANSVLLSYNGDDHIAYDNGDPCVTKTVDGFFLTGALPSSDPRCNF